MDAHPPWTQQMPKHAAWIIAAALAAGPQADAQESKAPYSVSVWARVLFGLDGKPVEYELVDESRYPAGFAENVKARVARASIRAPEIDGRAVTLRSGVELRFTITPTDAGGTVRVDGVSIGAVPVRKYLASYPKDIAQTGGWEGEASAVCRIGTDGRCASIDVAALPGMPESVRRYMRASLERWEFEPQQIDGKPVEGEYRLAVRFNTLDNAPEDFREDKFLRLLRNR